MLWERQGNFHTAGAATPSPRQHCWLVTFTHLWRHVLNGPHW